MTEKSYQMVAPIWYGVERYNIHGKQRLSRVVLALQRGGQTWLTPKTLLIGSVEVETIHHSIEDTPIYVEVCDASIQSGLVVGGVEYEERSVSFFPNLRQWQIKQLADLPDGFIITRNIPEFSGGVGFMQTVAVFTNQPQLCQVFNTWQEAAETCEGTDWKYIGLEDIHNELFC